MFVPLIIELGISPNVNNALLPNFAQVVGFARRWQPDAGVGTTVAMMLPYTAAVPVHGPGGYGLTSG